jgi:hypothetical protein
MKPGDPLFPEYVQETLHRKAVASRYQLDPEMMAYAKFDVWQQVADHLLCTLKSYVWEQQLAPDKIQVSLEKPYRQVVPYRKHLTQVVQVPASWWQHLKQDHFPAWYLSRWPVEYRDRVVSYSLDDHVVAEGTVRFSDEVIIERSLTYPDPKLHLPDSSWGRAVYVERTVLPWER